MAALRWENLIAWRKLALDEEALSMTGTWPEYDLDTTFFDGTPIHLLVVLLLELQQAMTCSHEVIHQLEGLHAKLLRDRLAICAAPAWNVRSVHYVVLDFSSDAHSSNPRPVRRVSFKLC